FYLDSRGSSAFRDDHDLVVELRLEVHIDVQRDIEKAFDVSVVERFDTQDVWTRIQARDNETAIVAQRESSDELLRSHVERDDVRTKHTFAAFGDLPADAPGVSCVGRIRINVADSCYVVRLQGAPEDRAGRKRNREH